MKKMRFVRCFTSLATVYVAFVCAGNLPAEPSQALPKMDFILERVMERARMEEQNDFEFRQLHTYRTVRLKEQFGSEGKVTSRQKRDRTHSPNPDLPPKPFVRSNSRQNVGANQADEAQAAAEMQKGRAFEKSDFLDSELVRKFKFKLIGRELVGDRPALVVDFRPASKSLPARNLKEKFINRAAGRVWVDEQDWALVRGNLRLTEPVHVLGGLVGSVYRFRCQFTRDRTSEGFYYTSNMNWSVEGRQLLSPKAVAFQEHKTQVRKVREYAS